MLATIPKVCNIRPYIGSTTEWRRQKSTGVHCIIFIKLDELSTECALGGNALMPDFGR